MQEIGIETSLVPSVVNGELTIIGRLGKPRFLKMAVGDVLNIREDLWKDGKIVASYPDAAQVKITQVLYFETFKEMLEAVDFTQAVPSAKSLDEAVERYRQFYSSEDEEEYGVVALYIQPI